MSVIKVSKSYKETTKIIKYILQEEEDFKHFDSYKYNKTFNYTYDDIVKIFGQPIDDLGISKRMRYSDDEYIYIDSAWSANIDTNENKCYIGIYEVEDEDIFYEDIKYMSLVITNSCYVQPFFNYLDRKLGKLRNLNKKSYVFKLYDKDDILKIKKIQKNCEKWLWKPICNDGTIGINLRLVSKELNFSYS